MGASERATDATRQIAMVLDLNERIGCQTGTIACKKLRSQDTGTEDTGTDYAYWNDDFALDPRTREVI